MTFDPDSWRFLVGMFGYALGILTGYVIWRSKEDE